MAPRSSSSPMLRSAVIVIGALCLVGGGLAVLAGAMPGFVAMVWGLILLLGTLYERFRYKALVKEGPHGAVRTNERFVDDSTGRTVTVYIDPTSGERSYVEE
jgi:hypothetical protein